MRNIRTDMAVELQENLPSEQKGISHQEEKTRGGLNISRVRIENDEGARAMGKPIGNYITIETKDMEEITPKNSRDFAKEIGREIGILAEGCMQGTILIVGLGNRNVTPDALGPLVCERVFVSRHIKENIPEMIDERAATVCAIAPGVLGVTGMETGEVIKGVAEELHPTLVIAIDALAARKTGRIGTSVQIADTGISPGSGLGSNRKALNQESLGAKVIALGIPMVTYASTIAEDLIENALDSSVEQADLQQLVSAVVSAKGGDLIVTPKNIDMLIDKTASLLAESLNYALHPRLSEKEIRSYME